MTLAPQLLAAAHAMSVLDRLGYRGCLIGGLALQRWGQPRFTQDVDLTLLAPFGRESEVVDRILTQLSPRAPDARGFALARRVLLCVAPNGVSIDISLAALSFEEEVLSRASRWREVDGVWLETCSAEDLIVYKLVAARPQDVADVYGVVRRQGARLDVERIRFWGHQFAELKEDPDLLRPFEDAVRAAADLLH
jgi:hypothetical protein